MALRSVILGGFPTTPGCQGTSAANVPTSPRIRPERSTALYGVTDPDPVSAGFLADASLVARLHTSAPSRAVRGADHDAIFFAGGRSSGTTSRTTASRTSPSRPATRSRSSMFPNHAVGNICDDSYEGFFASAVPTIDTTCDNLIPG